MDLRHLARDSGVVSHGIVSDRPWLRGSFEDDVTEVGWRVLAYSIDENEWCGWWPTSWEQA